MKTFYVLIALLLVLSVACNNANKNESDGNSKSEIWNNRQFKLLKFSTNNEFLVIAATKPNDSKIDSLRDFETLTKLFIFKNIIKNNSNNRSWSLVSETKVFGAWQFEELYIIKSNSMALALAQTNLGGAHGMNDMNLFKIDTSGKVEDFRDPFIGQDFSEHFGVTVEKDSIMTMNRDQGIYKFSLVGNKLVKTFNSNIEKALDNGAFVAKYILSNNKIRAYESSTIHLTVGQSIVFDGADAKTNKTPIEGIFSDAWNSDLTICEANRLRDFTYTFDKPGEFHFVVAYQTELTTRYVEIVPTFTVIVSPK